MSIPRFYIDHDELGIPVMDAANLPVTLTISGDPARHMSQVLRLQPGNELVLFTGQGHEMHAVIRQAGKHSTEVEILRLASRSVESGLNITLAQGVSRSDRMDWTVQKAVELGVTNIVPVIAERTVVNLKGDHRERRVKHWQKVAISACEQCGRNIVPPVLPATRFTDYLAGLAGESTEGQLRLVLHHEAEEGLMTVTKGQPPGLTNVLLLIGPEGGLTEAEYNDARRAGFVPVRMGPRILRTETAAIAAIAVVQSVLGDTGE